MSALAALTLIVSGCGAYPKDPNQTTAQIEERGTIRIGLIALSESQNARDMQEFAELLATSYEVDPNVVNGSAEALMSQLKRGELDIVIGELPKNSPWAKEAAFTTAFSKNHVSKSEPVVRGAVHLGENRWLLSVERIIEEHTHE